MESVRGEGRRLKVAMVGCGKHAWRSVLPSLDYVAAELVATVNRTVSRAQETAKRFGAKHAYGSLEEAIEHGGFEAVLIAVDAEQHPKLACQALEAGLHVWMEKPPAEDVAGIDRMIRAREASGRNVVVGFKKMFMPGLQRMKRFVEGREFGAVRTIQGRFPIAIKRERRGVAAGFNGWLQNGGHALSAFVYLAGRPTELVVHEGRDGTGFVVMRFPDGSVGNLHLAWGHAMSGPLERYEVVCEHGHMVLENNTRLLVYRPGYPFDYDKDTDFARGEAEVAALVYEPQHTFSTLDNKALFIQGFVPELEHFVSACLEGRKPTVGTLEQARAVMECYEAGLWSEGEMVRLDKLPEMKD